MTDNQIPWYIRLLTFFGASMAGGFLLLFLGLFNLLDSTTLILFFGFTFVISATLLSYVKDSGFIEPTTISLVNLGQALTIFGFYDILKSDITSLLVLAFFLQVIFYLFFKSIIQKFLSVLMAVVSLVAILVDTELQILFPILFYSVLLLLYWNLYSYNSAVREGKQLSSYLVAAKESLTISLILLFIFPLVDEKEDLQRSISLVTSFLVFASLFVLLWNQLYKRLQWKMEYLFGVFLVIGLIFLPTAYHPGILGSVFILILGFSYSQKLTQVFGIFSTLGYLIHYYYSLETTLLYKSYQMILSGVIFLAVYAVWQFKLSKKEGAI